MKKIKKIFIIFIVFLMSYNLNNIFARNLVYEGSFSDVLEDGVEGILVTSYAQASVPSKNKYKATKLKDKWGYIQNTDHSNTGGSGSYASYYLAFHPTMDEVTNYIPGFNTSNSNSTNINVFYDSTNSVNLNRESSYHPSVFIPNEVNIATNQGTTTSGFMRKDINGTDIKNIKWKIEAGEVRVDLQHLSNEVVQELRQKYAHVDLMNTGIRYSSGARTPDNFSKRKAQYGDKNKVKNKWSDQNKSNMDSSWKILQTIVGFWNEGSRGFNVDSNWNYNATSSYRAGGAAVNLFDNILKLPIQGEDLTRTIYVDHVNEEGIKLIGFEFKSATVKTGSKTEERASEPKSGFQETYTIKSGEEIEIKAQKGEKVYGTAKNQYGETYDVKYTFLRGEASAGPDLNAAKNLADAKKYRFTDNPAKFKVSTGNKNDVVVIKLIYTKNTQPPSVKGNLPNLTLIGKLCFINELDPEYSGSTTGDNVDYSPSTGTITTGRLTPYIKGAYPYVVRALKYDKITEEESRTATSTPFITYHYNKWTYKHEESNRKFICTKTEHTHDSGCKDEKGKNVCGQTSHTHTGKMGSCYEHFHDGNCNWYESKHSKTINKPFYYNVPFQHVTYALTNFKMYRITKMEVFDKDSNIGGTLFGGGTYTVTPSSAYESRFNTGYVQRQFSAIFANKTYVLDDVTRELIKPQNNYSTSSGSTKDSEEEAHKAGQSMLDSETYATAAKAVDMRIYYKYDNDYMLLDGTDNMLERNYKAWDEYIDKPINSKRTLDSTKAGDGWNNSDATSIEIRYTGNLMSFMKPNSKLTGKNDWNDNYQNIPSFRDNGIREPYAKIYYDIIDNKRGKYNIGSDDFRTKDATYQINVDRGIVSSRDFQMQEKTYRDNDVNVINVMTPVALGEFDLKTEQKVDHSGGAGDTTILQKNAEFTITPTTSGNNAVNGYNFEDTRQFVKGYIFTFDFDVIYEGRYVEAYTSIYRPGANASIKARPSESFGADTADKLKNSIKVVIVSTNVPQRMEDYLKNATFFNYNFTDFGKNTLRSSGRNQSGYNSRDDIRGDSFHAAWKTINTRNIGRIFDFAVTDCTDLSFKNVFKKQDSNNVNTPTGKVYYSGYKKWKLNSAEYNEMIPRDDIGTSPQTILPLGPYKHTNATYISAPKMGYRISFDLKTSGYMLGDNSDGLRYIEITPSYYYVSKDGKTFDNNIKLYYKNSNGKYSDFSTSGYTIYYKPNDGYRYLRNSEYTDNFTSMSSKLEPLTVSTMFKLTNKTMSTSNTSFLQSWYGEFKLPNSTIAVSKNTNSSNGNINNPYQNGYIGVIFDIRCVDSDGFTLSYNSSDKSASSTNTSQWDYEGFMNFKTPGSNVVGNLKYQLEKDMWYIDNSLYQKVKGTVALFDLDNRAASDFE